LPKRAEGAWSNLGGNRKVEGFWSVGRLFPIC
jgi:hypothetical protein